MNSQPRLNQNDLKSNLTCNIYTGTIVAEFSRNSICHNWTRKKEKYWGREMKTWTLLQSPSKDPKFLSCRLVSCGLVYSQLAPPWAPTTSKMPRPCTINDQSSYCSWHFQWSQIWRWREVHETLLWTHIYCWGFETLLGHTQGKFGYRCDAGTSNTDTTPYLMTLKSPKKNTVLV